MQVFVLCQVFDYEGEYLLGVYASREEAVAAARVYRQHIDGFALYRREIGAAAVLDGAADEYFDGTE